MVVQHNDGGDLAMEYNAFVKMVQARTKTAPDGSILFELFKQHELDDTTPAELLVEDKPTGATYLRLDCLCDDVSGGFGLYICCPYPQCNVGLPDRSKHVHAFGALGVLGVLGFPNQLPGQIVAKIIDCLVHTLLEEAILDAINDLRDNLTRDNNTLCQGTPLVHGITGTAVPNFPGTIADLNALAGGDLSAILMALGHPANGTVSQRQSCLLIAIGITKLTVAR